MASSLRLDIFGAAFKPAEPTMDLMLVAIVLAILATVATMFLGLLTMSGGGAADRQFGTPLMWARI
jgi:hypothetical protein